MSDSPLEKRDSNVGWANFRGTVYLEAPLQPYNFLLQDTLLKGELGVIAGPPGAGKGLFAIQMAVSLAAGLPVFDWWQVPTPCKVVYLSAEDGWHVLQHRITSALAKLPEVQQRKTAENIYLVPVRGNVHLIEDGANSSITVTDNFRNLREQMAVIRPDLVFLDTFSRFICIEENSNAVMTRACGIIEEIAEEFSCNFIFLHHVNKASGEFSSNEKSLATALSQSALRGASALPGAIRFAAILAPLQKMFVARLLGNAHMEKPSGTALAVRTVKKNIGAPEEYFFLTRRENGLLERTYVKGDKSTTLKVNAHMLAAEVARRQAAGEKPLSRSRGGCEVLGLGTEKAELVTSKAIEMGILSSAPSGRGYILVPGKSYKKEED